MSSPRSILAAALLACVALPALAAKGASGRPASSTGAAPTEPALSVRTPARGRAAREAVPTTADEVFERYIRELGGEEALRAVRTRHLKGTWNGRPFANITSMEIWSAAPNSLHMVLTDPLGGRVEIGFDGTVGWERYNSDTPTPIEADRLVNLSESAAFYGEVDFRTRYAETRLLGPAMLDDKPVTTVYARTHAGRERQLLFDQASGLLVAERTTMALGNGRSAVVENRFEAYERVGEVLVPVVQRQVVLGADDMPPVVMRYEDVQINSFEEHDFSMPDAGTTNEPTDAPKPAAAAGGTD